MAHWVIITPHSPLGTRVERVVCDFTRSYSADRRIDTPDSVPEEAAPALGGGRGDEDLTFSVPAWSEGKGGGGERGRGRE